MAIQLAPAVTNVVVNPGLTTPLTIVDKQLPPPPDAGSIKVIKFYCPQTAKGETNTVYDSSDQVADAAGADRQLQEGRRDLHARAARTARARRSPSAPDRTAKRISRCRLASTS